jgi:hypothetical protein
MSHAPAGRRVAAGRSAGRFAPMPEHEFDQRVSGQHNAARPTGVTEFAPRRPARAFQGPPASMAPCLPVSGRLYAGSAPPTALDGFRFRER